MKGLDAQQQVEEDAGEVQSPTPWACSSRAVDPLGSRGAVISVAAVGTLTVRCQGEPSQAGESAAFPRALLAVLAACLACAADRGRAGSRPAWATFVSGLAAGRPDGGWQGCGCLGWSRAERLTVSRP